MFILLPSLTTGRVDDVSQLGVLPLAQVVLFHTGSGFGRLHLRTPAERNRRAWVETDIYCLRMQQMIHGLHGGRAAPTSKKAEKKGSQWKST